MILILSDDQGWGDLGINGNPQIETPHLDSLAGNGARFDRFYVSPLGALTRASLLTGRYSMRTGAVSVSGGLETMNGEETTLAELFRANGYRTGCFGKWHNGSHYPSHPNDQGFDEFFGFCGRHLANYFDSRLEHNRKEILVKGFITDELTDKAIGFIQENKERPFFCYLPYNAPHGPLQVPDSFFDKYKGKGLDDERAAVYGLCDNMDSNIGRLLEVLDELNLREKTIVIFLSDNGPNNFRFNGNMKGIKGSVDEGGMRVPCLVSWPGRIRANSIVKQIAAHIDLFPTLFELCQLKNKPGVQTDGMSLAKILLGESVPVTDRIFYDHIAFPEPKLFPYPGTIWSNQYRLVVNRDSLELYDLIDDPSQLLNRAKEQKAITNRLYQDYTDWFRELSYNVKMEHAILLDSVRIELPVVEAYFNGKPGLKEVHGRAYDRITGWENTNDSIWWNVTIKRPIEFTVYLQYTCQPGEEGSALALSAGDVQLTTRIDRSFDKGVIPSPDRVPRKEAYEKEWGIFKMGRLKMKPGNFRLLLRATFVNNKSVAELGGLILQPQNSN